MPTDLPLQYIAAEPLEPTPNPPLMIMFHGFGSNEQDLFALREHLDPRLRIVSARGHIDLSHAGMPGGTAWFELIFRPDGIDYDRDSADDAAQRVAEFVRMAMNRFDASDRTISLGFSQGAMLCHSLVLATTPGLAAAAAISGRAVDRLFTPTRDWSGMEKFPLWVSHGIHDDVIPIESGRRIREYYEASPVALEYHEYDDAHSIGSECLADLNRWTAARVDRLLA